jgi:hypothetical protein
MSKMIDLGKKFEGPAEVATQEGHSKQERNYPEMHVESDQPLVSADHVGKHVKATVHLHIKGHETRVGSDGKETQHAHFAVKKMQIHEGTADDENGEHEITEENPDRKKADRLSAIKKDYKGEE